MATSRSPFVPHLTVRDIAKRIRRDDEDLEVVVNRLRNWTKEGLLQFSGNKHPGSGKSRLYPPRAVIDALVLSALTAMGIPAVRIGGDAGPYASVLNYGLVGYEQFQEKEAAAQEIYLLIGADGSIYDDAKPHFVDLCFAKEDIAKTQLTAVADVMIVLNLSKLFRRIEQRNGEE
jgi:hypothetical protein